MSFAKIGSKTVAGSFGGRPLFVWLWIIAMLCLPALGLAQTASVQLSKYPDAILADGASTVTISVQVRNKNGSIVPDGTQVLFETTLGSVRPNLVETKNGFAQTTLTSDAIPGVAKVTASVLAYRSTATIEVKFAATREELKTEQFVATLSAPNRLTYSPEQRILRADGPGQKVHLIGPQFELFADDLQYEILKDTVIAKQVRLVLKETELNFVELSLNVRDLTGFGLGSTTYLVPIVHPKAPSIMIDFQTRQRLGPVNLVDGKTTPRVQGLDPKAFEFTPIDTDVTLVYARQATIYPQKEVQFRTATVDIQGSKILRGVPLFRVSTQSVTPVLTEEFVRVSDNSFNVDFPYYLNLSAADSSNFRFRYGTMYSRGFGSSGGMYLDFEKNWSMKDDQRGYFALQGIGRKDWGLTTRQSLNLWKNGNAYLQADFPANRAIVGSVSADSRVGGHARASYNGGIYQTVKGDKYTSYDHTLSLRQDPLRIGRTPLSLNFGVLGALREFKTSSSSLFSRSYGADLQILLSTQRIGQASINASARLSQFWGYNIRKGLTTGASATLSSPLGSSGSLQLTYDYSDDLFSAQTVGRHRLAVDFGIDSGRFYLTSFLSKSLDVDRYNLQGDLSYRFNPRWRFGATATHESFRGTSYSDFGAVIAFNLGLREIGISYSQRRKRLGFEILGAPIH